ncbi:hypothetical protein AOQ84DRAFT_11279 [Glonium stellatum]|uniref:Uncharacterized protein n=1 Tax=Glonium stellatum TaxID=574774 RepID=A0A8E2FCL2_9PEZI|nr:hypothetical protein AOQ84DRAFT_11279 [Glonium stellatum]
MTPASHPRGYVTYHSLSYAAFHSGPRTPALKTKAQRTPRPAQPTKQNPNPATALIAGLTASRPAPWMQKSLASRAAFLAKSTMLCHLPPPRRRHRRRRPHPGLYTTSLREKMHSRPCFQTRASSISGTTMRITGDSMLSIGSWWMGGFAGMEA